MKTVLKEKLMIQSAETQFFNIFYDIKDINIIDQIINVVDDTYSNIIQIC